jgi:hypothetical protein
VETELRFVAGLVPPVAIGAFVAGSLALILWSARRSPAGSNAGVFSGLVPGVTAGVLLFVPAVILYAVVASLDPAASRFDDFGQEALLAFVFIVGPITLAVLDLYAIWPPVRRTRAGAAGRAFVGVILVVSCTTLLAWIVTALDSAAFDEYLAAEKRALEARSAGLSMEVAVVDTVLGDSTDNGQVVSRLTLDITVRSTTSVQLLPLTEPEFVNQELWIGPAGFVSVGVGAVGLPTYIRAGFEETYRVYPVLSNEIGIDEDYTTGAWEAKLDLIGLYNEAGSSITYRAASTFTVHAGP